MFGLLQACTTSTLCPSPQNSRKVSRQTSNEQHLILHFFSGCSSWMSLTPDICCFCSRQSKKGRFCRVTTCQSEHLQSRMGGPVEFECTLNAGVWYRPHHSSTQCNSLLFQALLDGTVTPDPPHETKAVWSPHVFGFRLSNHLFPVKPKLKQGREKMSSWNEISFRGFHLCQLFFFFFEGFLFFFSKFVQLAKKTFEMCNTWDYRKDCPRITGSQLKISK